MGLHRAKEKNWAIRTKCWNLYPIDKVRLRCLLCWQMLAFILLNVAFGVTVAAVWTKIISPRKGKNQTRKAGAVREEFQIDSNAVPEFKPSWRRDL